MPTGLIVLVAITVLVYFGLLQRVLDRMHLTDKEALFLSAHDSGSLYQHPPVASTIFDN